MNNLSLDEQLKQAQNANQQREYDRAIQLYDALLSQNATSEDDPAGHVTRLQALSEKGEILRLRGEYNLALTTFEQYLQEAQAQHEVATGLTLVGQQLSRLGQHHLALDHLRRALQIAHELALLLQKAKVFSAIGLIYYRLGQTEEATTNLKEAIALFTELNDINALAESWNTLGLVHHEKGELDKAIIAYAEAAQYARRVGVRPTAIYLNNLGEAYHDLFDMEQALRYHREALQLTKQIQLIASEGDLRRNLGVDLCALGQYVEGLNELYRALTICRETQNQEIEIQCLNSLAQVEISQGNLNIARKHIEQLTELAHHFKARTYIARAHYAWGIYHWEQGDEIAAQESWQQALFLAHETGQRMVIWNVHARLAEAVANSPLAKVHWQIASEVIQQIVEPIEDRGLRQKFLDAPAVKRVLDLAQAN